MPKYIEQIVDEQLKRSEFSRRLAQERLGAPLAAVRPRVITISRQRGCNGTRVAEELASRLHWSLWGRELVDAIAEHSHLQRKVIEPFDEKTVSEIEVLARTLLGEPEIGGFIYGRELARALLSIAKRGNAVILGRAANFVLPNALNIRLEASEETRIRNLVSAEGLSHEQAVSEIRRSERERSAFARQVFGKDIGDHRYYDLAIQMDCFGVDDAIETILTAAETQFPELREMDIERWRQPAATRSS